MEAWLFRNNTQGSCGSRPKLDEPSEGLVPIVLKAIRERLQDLTGRDLSILLVEQNLGLAMALADRIVILGAAVRSCGRERRPSWRRRRT